MSKYLKPRTLYLAALGLAAMMTVDMVRRVRRQEFDVPDSVSDTVDAVTQRVAATAGAVTARAGKIVEAVRPGHDGYEDIEMEMVEVEREVQLPVEAGSEADVTAVAEEIEEAVEEAVAELAEAAAQDLTEIKGIGPTYARRLHAVGIMTYADVANADPEYLREVTRATGAQADPEAWIAEARAMS